MCLSICQASLALSLPRCCSRAGVSCACHASSNARPLHTPHSPPEQPSHLRIEAPTFSILHIPHMHLLLTNHMSHLSSLHTGA